MIFTNVLIYINLSWLVYLMINVNICGTIYFGCMAINRTSMLLELFIQ